MRAKEIHVGKLIEDACKQSNYKLTEIAQKVGVTKQTLNGWFKKDDIRVKVLFTLSEALGVDLVARFTQPQKDSPQRTKVVLQIEVEDNKTNEVLDYIKDKGLSGILKNKDKT